MMTWLARRFVEGKRDIRQAYGILSGVVGICLNLLLFGFKLAAGVLTGAISITADAFNNLSDAGASIVTLLGFKLAAQKADAEHPFGHGRMEYVAGFIVSLLILLMGFQLAGSSIQKIITPEAPSFSILAIVILGASILVKAYMAFYNGRIGRRIASPAMRATALDSLSDCAATLVVLASTLITRFAGVNVDAYAGILVSVFIFISGLRAAKETIDPLLGQPPDPAFVRRVEAMALETPGVLGVHDLMIHDYGPGRRIISFHAEVSSQADFMEIHDTIDNLERAIQEETGALTVIHMDPLAVDDAHTMETRDKVAALVRTIDERLTIHDFRMVEGPTHTNVIFDVVVPLDLPFTDDMVRRKIAAQVRALDGNYFAVVQVDKQYIAEG